MRQDSRSLVLAFLLTWAAPSILAWTGEPSSPSDEAGHRRSAWTVAIDAIPWTAAVEEVGVFRLMGRLVGLLFDLGE